MSGEDSEEKTEQPTKRKLDDARKKGQVSTSKDVITVVLTVAVFTMLWLSSQTIFERFAHILSITGDLSVQGFAEGAGVLAADLVVVALAILGPLAAVVVVLTFGTGIVVSKGLVLSAHPMKPDGNKINPAKGLKRIFSRKNLIEGLKSIAKVALIVLLFVVVLRFELAQLLFAPLCGGPCVLASFGKLILPFMAAVGVIFLVFAFLDWFLQDWLFRFEMRMTKTELKREYKEREGDPLIKGRRRQLARELAASDPIEGARAATLVLVDGANVAVGLRYAPPETPLPIYVALGMAAGAAKIIDIARAGNIPILERPQLAQTLFDSGHLDSAIEERHVLAVAEAMGQARPFG